MSKYSYPDFAVIVNTGSSHIGRLKTVENIAKAKCEITARLHPEGVLFAQNSVLIKNANKYKGETVYLSLDMPELQILKRTPEYSEFVFSCQNYRLNVGGDHNIMDALYAICIGLKMGMNPEKIAEGIAAYKPIEKRWEIQEINGYKIINDSYNANPESMKASVSTFLELYKNPVVILGDMGELGENEIEFHRETGEFIGRKFQGKQAVFLTVGKLAKYIGDELAKCGFDIKHFDSNLETSRYILDNLHAGITIFLKASRAMKFEEIIENLKNGD